MNKFQPKKKTLDNEKIVISIRLDSSRINEIDNIAGKIDISRNEFINQCIEYALNNIEFNEEIKKETE